MSKPNLLLIPESRKRPLIKSLLYKQIIRYFDTEGLEKKFEIAFITLDDGIVRAQYSENISEPTRVTLPPRRFQSGKSWVTQKDIKQIAILVAVYFTKTRDQYIKRIIYARGAYLEIMRLAGEMSGTEVEEIFSEKELTELKKKGWLWMKVGLRMPEAFEIFKKKIKESTKEEDGQLKFNFPFDFAQDG